MPVAREHVTENGMLVQHMADGSTIRKCLTDRCIRESVKKDSTMKTDNCGCEECESKMLSKSDDDTLDTESVEVLDEQLPPELFEQVMEHFKVGEVENDENEDVEIDDVPEDPEQVGKALAKSLYDENRPERSGGVPSAQHLGNIVDEKSASGGSAGSAEVYARSLLEKETVDLSKTADAPDSLNRFYESQGESL